MLMPISKLRENMLFKLNGKTYRVLGVQQSFGGFDVVYENLDGSGHFNLDPAITHVKLA